MNFSQCWNFIFILVFLIQFSHGNIKSHYHRRLKYSLDTNFDVLIFTQHWPQSVCFEWKEKSQNHKCTLPVDEEWTIHGIWPTQYHKIGPEYCNKTAKFDLSALSTIEDELKLKWMDVEYGMKPGSFWKHEYEKHGTCAAVLEKMNSEIKYFQMGLNFLDKYDMKNILAKVNITPGNSYPVKTILNGIKNILDVNAQIMCVKNPKTHESYIFEIRICFDKQLKLTNCDGIVNFPTDCNHSQDVIYPGTVPHEVFRI